MVEEIIGHRVKGTVDLASNDVISSVFPHFHEVMHLLVNIKLQELPFFTLPIMREGFAVRYGGRWGKKSTALMELGVFLYREKLVELDSVLTLNGFETKPVRICLSGGRRFQRVSDRQARCEEDLGPVSPDVGRFSDLEQMTSFDVKNVITGATGHDDWTALIADFDKYVEKQIAKHAFALPAG